jgi:glutamyl-Q tRNA(Asp) synthetase
MIGRFAPSPTGPLHFGSLLAALASYLEAKKSQGKWLVRMEDLDKPREMKGAAEDILRTLEAYGLYWDGEIVHQSRRTDLYQSALNQLNVEKRTYACSCSRKEIQDSVTNSQIGIEGIIYPGTCREKHITKIPHAIRVKTLDQNIRFEDTVQGFVTQNLAKQIGDFVVKRADNLFAYQLAVVVDDHLQGITHIVRGADLLDSSTRQIYLQDLLGYQHIQYAHIPAAHNQQGEKLSKQTFAQAISAKDARKNLYQALCYLGQRPPADLGAEKTEQILSWAKDNWNINKVPKQKSTEI